MKGLACPCPALPHFCQLGSYFMAEGSRAQAPRQGPPVSVQFLRAQYEGLRRQQRNQAHLVVFPKGANTPVPAESMINAVWINKKRRSSLSPEEVDPEVAVTLEDADWGCPPAPESPWHTHLEMHRLAQTSHQETSQDEPNGQLAGCGPRLPLEGDPELYESNQKTQPRARTPEEAQHGCQVGSTQTKEVGSSSKTSLQYPSIKNPHRSGKPAYYPFPQRKTPRISQAARNLGLYGPA